METITFNTIQFVVGILVTVGSVLFSGFKLYNSLNDRLLKLESKSTDSSKEADVTNTTLKEIRDCINDIKTHQTEVRVMLFGSTGTNGMNSNIKDLKTDVKELRENFIQLAIQLKHLSGET